VSFEIKDISVPNEERHQLFINNAPMILLQSKHQQVKINFQVYGPLQLSEAKTLIDGMLHLCVIADEINERVKR
jgi:hypothetical protein